MPRCGCVEGGELLCSAAPGANVTGQLERGFATGSSHFGYPSANIPDPTGKRDNHGQAAMLGARLEIDESEAAIIRRVFEWYADGVGVPTIVRRLRADNAPGPRG